MPTDTDASQTGDLRTEHVPDGDVGTGDVGTGEVPLPARRARAVAPDATLVAAVDLARAAALDVAEVGGVGEHLGSQVEGERVLTHSFACTSAGYRGWRWAVTVARAPRSRTVTVSEVHLLPGPESIVPPTWLPWADRLAPGDVSPGIVLPRRPDDPSLEPGFEATGDEDVDQMAFFELGLGRPRVLSREGRQEAAQRWYDGAHGPLDPHAEQAPARCSTCGYFVPMAGALRQVFGVCASEWSPSDGQVVSLDHGCGAHSEADVEVRTEQVDAPVLDELGYESVQVERTAQARPPEFQPSEARPPESQPSEPQPSPSS